MTSLKVDSLSGNGTDTPDQGPQVLCQTILLHADTTFRDVGPAENAHRGATTVPVCTRHLRAACQAKMQQSPRARRRVGFSVWTAW